jgi:uncharacterized protein
LQKGVVAFEDLREGMMITGKIKNVVDFGAFVDLGIKETALVHISEMSDHFVKDPQDAVKVGDVLEFRIIALDRDRRRISLSRKSDPGRGEGGAEGRPGEPAAAKDRNRPGPAALKKKVKVVREAGRGSPASAPGPSAAASGQRRAPAEGRPSGGSRPGPSGGGHPPAGRPGDDGTMYNPFADAFKKMQERQGKK